MKNSYKISSVTGVDVSVDIAGPGARSFAFVIDWHIRLLLALAWYLLGTLAYTGTFEFISSDAPAFGTYFFVVLLPTIAIYGLYHPVLEIVMRGRTPGKRFAGVRIVDTKAQEPGIVALLIRNVLRILDSLPSGYLVGLISTLVTAQNLRIGDLAAGTLLIYDHQDTPKGPGGPDTDGITRWSQAEHAGQTDHFGLDSRAVAQAELIEDLIARWDELNPVKRDQLAKKLLAQLQPGAGEPTDLKAALEGLLK